MAAEMHSLVSEWLVIARVLLISVEPKKGIGVIYKQGGTVMSGKNDKKIYNAI